MTSPRDGAVLALDVGTSSTRASLYDVRGRPMKDRVARVGYTPTVTHDGGAELDPMELLDHVSRAIDQLLAEAAPAVVAVAPDTFWHSLLGVDAQGRPITPVYPWLDARSRAEVGRLRERLDEHQVHARTGCVLHWTYWPAKLMWLRRTQPDLFARGARWISFGELVLERLTGQRGSVSVSMASGTGLLNLHTCRWDAEMLSTVGLEERHLGRIVPLSEMASVSAEAATRWPQLKDVPWMPAVGDGAASNIGAGCAASDRFAAMIGTSAAERVVVSTEQMVQIPWGVWGYRVDERRAIFGGAFNDGGSLLGWLRGALHLPSMAAAEAELARLEPDGHGLTVLPFWGGERSTGWADDARGAIVGLRLHSRPIDILRACLEAVALRFGELDRILIGVMPESREVVGTGGALLHSPAWLQILADVLGRPVLASSEAEASSRGAALLALETLGLLEKPLEELRSPIRRRFEPIPAHATRYQAAAERQRQLYTSLVNRES
jgi:gluconokinase